MWTASIIVALLIIILFLLQATFNVLLLVLAGTLIAVYFRGLADFIRNKTNWKESFSVVASILVTLLFLILLFWLVGAKVQAQVQQLTETLPQTIENAKDKLNNSPLGKQVIRKISSPETQKQMKTIAQTFFKSTFGVLGDIYVVLFIGIFFTASPHLYTNGLIALVPPAGKNRAREVMQKIGINLKKWLKGKLFAMLVVTVLTSIGLLILGVPMWLALAVIAGLLNFIPNFGPLIALIPAALVGLMTSPITAVWVASLYIFVQVLESNLITPVVQKKLVNLPPAMIIIAQLLIAPLSGGWGLVVATPLLLIIMTLVQELYITKQESNRGGVQSK